MRSGALVHLHVRQTEDSLRTDSSGSPHFRGGIAGGAQGTGSPFIKERGVRTSRAGEERRWHCQMLTGAPGVCRPKSSRPGLHGAASEAAA